MVKRADNAAQAACGTGTAGPLQPLQPTPPSHLSRRALLAGWVPGAWLAAGPGLVQAAPMPTPTPATNAASARDRTPSTTAGAANTAAASAADEDAVAPGRRLRFPRDHGAHPAAAIEWWYATGWLDGPDGAPRWGFQITFFRSRPPQADVPAALAAGRFAPRQLLFAHAAVTDLAAGRHRHAQRITRWSGDEQWPEAHAARADTRLVLGAWSLQRRDRVSDGASGATGRTGGASAASTTSSSTSTSGRSQYTSRIAAPEAGFTLALTLEATQPLLLQGQAGFSQKGPLVQQASHYYSQPHLAVRGDLVLDGRRQAVTGTGWLDHEWSHALLAPGAVGWDWIGINLADGGALTAFVLRRADGSVLWGGGSHRPAGGAVRAFAPGEIGFTAGRLWTSPATGARYPVAWTIDTPVGRFGLRALLDAQELDSRASTGAANHF